MIEKTAYFVRHGQSHDNAAPVFQAPNSPLSELGRWQASRVAERISKLPFQALIASTFRRASETAEVIAKATGAEVEYSKLFVECMKPTSVNGKPHDDAAASALWRDWTKSRFTLGVRVADGENFDDLIKRADEALAFLKMRPEHTLVVVTHGFFLRTMLARVFLGEAISGKSFESFQRLALMENTGITVLRYEDAFEEEPAWRLWTYNDHAHLG